MKLRFPALLLGAAFALAVVATPACSPKLIPGTAAPQLYRMDSTRMVDSMIMATYLPYKAQLESEMTRVIAQGAQALVAAKGQPESLVGNFFVDAMMVEGKKLTPEIDFALATRDGIRAPLPKGNITVSHVFELMPFENELVLLELKGSDALQLIQVLAASGGHPVSGLRFTIRDKKAENIEVHGKAFDVNKTYKVLTYDYLANGGDGLSMLKSAISNRTLGKKLRDAILENLEAKTAAGQSINAQLDGRIKHAGN